MGILDRHMRVNRVALRIAFQTAGGDKAVARQYDVRDAQVNGLSIDSTAGKHSNTVIHFDACQPRGGVGSIQNAVAPATRSLSREVLVQKRKMRGVAFSFEA